VTLTERSLSHPLATSIADVLGETIEFSKYTSFGNTFIVIDETDNRLRDDEQRAAFARWLLNRDFGIGGADNVLYLRAAEQADRSADGNPADVVFRIFEYDGAETLSCGNGLLSTAAYFRRVTGDSQWSVLTELPSGRPKLVEVGVGPLAGGMWVNVGWPRPVAAELYRRSGPAPATAIDEVPPLSVPIPNHENWASGLPETISLSGLLTFTGEPHLVLFEGHGFPSELAERIWVKLDADRGSALGLRETPRMAASRLLVHHLGSYVNQRYRELFPQGVHLNFARILGDGIVEYRTWERAIDCETLACGSGAVAMTHVGRTYGLLQGTQVTFWPHRCRWYQPQASLGVNVTDNGFLLSGRPKLVCIGMAPKFP
jgi:diaminopimelate epimerase